MGHGGAGGAGAVRVPLQEDVGLGELVPEALAQLDLERDAMAHAFGTDEAQEGITAFLEKRPPSFS